MPRFRLGWIGLAVLVAIGIAVYGGTHLYATQSEPFDFAQRWVLESGAFEPDVGQATTVTLLPASGFQITFEGSDRTSKLVVEIAGNKGTVRAILELEKKLGDWRVVKVTRIR